ncbi:hypothetical protein K9M79_01100 [Candidatus Woesearchaeota archaeon]|nr:hypothetical protein [Candidatus Woesearchaeota archaeon]
MSRDSLFVIFVIILLCSSTLYSADYQDDPQYYNENPSEIDDWSSIPDSDLDSIDWSKIEDPSSIPPDKLNGDRINSLNPDAKKKLQSDQLMYKVNGKPLIEDLENLGELDPKQAKQALYELTGRIIDGDLEGCKASSTQDQENPASLKCGDQSLEFNGESSDTPIIIHDGAWQINGYTVTGASSIVISGPSDNIQLDIDGMIVDNIQQGAQINAYDDEGVQRLDIAGQADVGGQTFTNARAVTAFTDPSTDDSGYMQLGTLDEVDLDSGLEEPTFKPEPSDEDILEQLAASIVGDIRSDEELPSGIEKITNSDGSEEYSVWGGSFHFDNIDDALVALQEIEDYNSPNSVDGSNSEDQVLDQALDDYFAEIEAYEDELRGNKIDDILNGFDEESSESSHLGDYIHQGDPYIGQSKDEDGDGTDDSLYYGDLEGWVEIPPENGQTGVPDSSSVESAVRTEYNVGDDNSDWEVPQRSDQQTNSNDQNDLHVQSASNGQTAEFINGQPVEFMIGDSPMTVLIGTDHRCVFPTQNYPDYVSATCYSFPKKISIQMGSYVDIDFDSDDYYDTRIWAKERQGNSARILIEEIPPSQRLAVNDVRIEYSSTDTSEIMEFDSNTLYDIRNVNLAVDADTDELIEIKFDSAVDNNYADFSGIDNLSELLVIENMNDNTTVHYTKYPFPVLDIFGSGATIGYIPPPLVIRLYDNRSSFSISDGYIGFERAEIFIESTNETIKAPHYGYIQVTPNEGAICVQLGPDGSYNMNTTDNMKFTLHNIGNYTYFFCMKKNDKINFNAEVFINSLHAGVYDLTSGLMVLNSEINLYREYSYGKTLFYSGKDRFNRVNITVSNGALRGINLDNPNMPDGRVLSFTQSTHHSIMELEERYCRVQESIGILENSLYRTTFENSSIMFPDGVLFSKQENAVIVYYPGSKHQDNYLKGKFQGFYENIKFT